MSGKSNTAWMTTMVKKHGSREAVKERMQQIGAAGGKNSNNGGSAKYQFCNCELIEEVHYKQRCAGKKGGQISKRRKSDG